MSSALLCALLFRVEVLGLLHLREAVIEGAGAPVHARAEGDAVRLDGGPPGPRARLAPQPGWPALVVRVAGLPPRAFEGALELSAHAGELSIVDEVGEDGYVAAVVAAELGPGAPEEAARALAIAARSFALARTAGAAAGGAASAGEGPQRAHPSGAPLCDQTHCQVFRGRPEAAARAAAEATRGQVLLLASGKVAPALHHAACGGRTAGAREIWPGATDDDEEAGAAVDDPLPGSVPAGRPGAPPGIAPRGLAACAEHEGEAPLRWTARVTEPQLARALGLQAPLGLTAAAGPGGLLARLDVSGLGRLTAEELHLRLGRALGWDTVRSPRFRWEESPADPAASTVRSWLLRGQGHGHGVGLCQRGAAQLARTGYTASRILGRYFPRLRVGPLPKGPNSQ